LSGYAAAVETFPQRWVSTGYADYATSGEEGDDLLRALYAARRGGMPLGIVIFAPTPPPTLATAILGARKVARRGARRAGGLTDRGGGTDFGVHVKMR
jgi:hypothetical protein